MINFDAKDTAIGRFRMFCFRNRTLSKASPMVMGILNLTPDSFYSDSRIADEKALLSMAGQMLEQGADLLDLGAVSTRPGAQAPDAETEYQRLIPAVRTLVKHFPEAFISVDTFRATIAEAAVQEGAFMVNDISGGTFDAKMLSLVGQLNVPYVLMHIHGTPANMQLSPLHTTEVMGEVRTFFEHQALKFEQHGARQLILDPGFGFGKTLAANYLLLKKLPELRIKQYPLLVGISRKSMIYKALNSSPEAALNGSTALHVVSLLQGADILRVHDVKEAVEAIRLITLTTNAQRDSK